MSHQLMYRVNYIIVSSVLFNWVDGTLNSFRAVVLAAGGVVVVVAARVRFRVDASTCY